MSSTEFSKYKNSVKMIYIDPPYNTKSIKTYNDNLKTIDWNMFMEPRLSKAKDFLTEDGCIFISIDDNEFANLKIMCDKIFGKENFTGNFITYQALRSNSKHINTVHEYVLCYAKNKKKLNEFKIKRIDNTDEKKIIDSLYRDVKKIIEFEGVKEANKKIKSLITEYCERYNITWLKNYNNVDEDGRIYFAMDLSTPGEPREVNIKSINLHLNPLPTRGWASDEKFIELYNDDLLSFKGNRPYEKHYLEDACDNVTSVLKFFSRHGTNDLKKLDLYNIFDTPKPVELIKFLIKISTKDDDLILDFFAGSGTTAQAVYAVALPAAPQHHQRRHRVCGLRQPRGRLATAGPPRPGHHHHGGLVGGHRGMGQGHPALHRLHVGQRLRPRDGVPQQPAALGRSGPCRTAGPSRTGEERPLAPRPACVAARHGGPVAGCQR